VSTVDSYQGQERDIIIISTVRSNFKGNVGFLSDYRRINVSLTRAKYALLVIGNGKTLSMNQTWESYIRWVKVNGFHLMYDGAEAGNTINITNMLNNLFDIVKPAVQHI
jgi:ATP-dependent RNA/DNA helicase IGHMBP2